MKLIGIGVGPGDFELLTLKAVKEIEGAAYIFIPESKGKSIAYEIAKPILKNRQNIVFLDIPMGCSRDVYRSCAQRIMEVSRDKTSVFLTLGDPNVYSTFTYTAEEIKKMGGEAYTISGIPSFIAASSAIGVPLLKKGEKMIVCDSVEGLSLENIDTVVVLKTVDKEKILDFFEERGFKYFYIRRCTQKDELILTNRQEILMDTDYLSMIVARRR
ncbi:precorrin-2 C(20)-methyltransferase [Thermobrachium celere]|uniref:Cobalt-precorrin-2 C20-methyltransferase n=1 Tax=Thermobrachium celere DSM 8682 TaxID=941824 RepID=R7RPP3_9CLOT|nr:precorrin-2 C(20)-methyltransferase [Thermobrachium celere]CDF57293.1 Cobalt-precorrin-2 C20-methyltransferase [Thermobrachium celere DSM 8682]